MEKEEYHGKCAKGHKWTSISLIVDGESTEYKFCPHCVCEWAEANWPLTDDTKTDA